MRVDRRAALTAVVAGGAALAAGAPARAQRGADRDTLERLLSLERGLESAYDAAARRGAIDGKLARMLRDQEREHAKGLEETLAGGPRPPLAAGPSPALSRALARGGTAFLRYALALEEEAVAAYADALTNLRDPDLLQPLGSIMGSEGQHLVVLRARLDARPLTRAFEPAVRR